MGKYQRPILNNNTAASSRLSAWGFKSISLHHKVNSNFQIHTGFIPQETKVTF